KYILETVSDLKSGDLRNVKPAKSRIASRSRIQCRRDPGQDNGDRAQVREQTVAQRRAAARELSHRRRGALLPNDTQAQQLSPRPTRRHRLATFSRDRSFDRLDGGLKATTALQVVIRPGHGLAEQQFRRTLAI